MNRLNVGTSVRGAAMVLLCIVAQLALPASPVAAHAFLESSDPAANAVLPTAPQSVTLTFTEPLESSYSRAELFDATGAQVPGATSTIGPEPRSMTVQIPPGLGNGTYSLLWRTLSTVDGHTAQGYLPFTIGTEADVRIVAPPAVADNSSALPEWALAVARWLALLGMAAVAAVWPVWLFVVRPAISPAWQLGPKLTRRVRRYATGAFAFSLLANLVALVVQAAAISGPADLLNGLTTTLGDTRYGTWWLVRVGVLLVFAAVLLGSAWWWPWRRRPATILALVASAALPLPFSMISHAGAEPAGQATAVAFDYAHLLGASLWAGGLLFLVVALAPTVRDLTAAGRRVVLGRALPRFSLLALIAWGVMGFTGLYSAWLQVGNIPALTGTPYGQTLILKLILIVPLLALGAFNLVVVTRKLRVAETEERVEGWSNHFVSALIAEAVIVTLLLGVVGMLIGTPPARQVMEQQAGSLRIALEAGGQTGTLIITPGTVGPNHYRLELGSGHEAHLRNPGVTDATLRLSLPERQTGQIDVPLIARAVRRLRGARLGAGVSRATGRCSSRCACPVSRTGSYRRRSRSRRVRPRRKSRRHRRCSGSRASRRWRCSCSASSASPSHCLAGLPSSARRPPGWGPRRSSPGWCCCSRRGYRRGRSPPSIRPPVWPRSIPRLSCAAKRSFRRTAPCATAPAPGVMARAPPR